MSGYMMGVKINAQAEREMAPLKRNQAVDITNPEMKTHLLRNSPQVNEVSKKEGNDGSICGGAAMTNALIMSSKTPEEAKANAKAVRDLTKTFYEFKMKPEEETALKHMENGKMSPKDVEHMQQLMDKVGKRMPLAGANPSGMGLSTTQIACAMTKLSAHGAFKGSDVKMHCSTLPSTPPTDHWTVSVDGKFANSASGPPKFDKSIVHGGTPSDVQKSSNTWQNEIQLNNSETPPKVIAQFKQPGDTNSYRQATFNTAEHKDPGSVGAFESEIRRAAQAPAIPIQ